MDVSRAKLVSFVKTIETSSDDTKVWSQLDAEWATRLAVQEVGESASPERFVEVRARIAWQRISDRCPELEKALKKHYFKSLLGWLVVVIAFVLGVTTDQVGESKQVNLLALPFAAIILWNLGMYGWLLVVSPVLRLFGARSNRPSGLGRLLSGLPQDRERSSKRAGKVALRMRCLLDWGQSCGALISLSLARVWHVAALMLVLGLIASIYARGLYIEYRVGWESTILDAADVQVILATLLSSLPVTFGLTVPDLATVEQMRFSAGGGLATARPWLHVMALLAICVIVIPRLALTLWSHFRIRLIERRFPIDLSDLYFQKLIATHSRQPVQITAIPYAKLVSAAMGINLNQIVGDVFGPKSTFKICETIPLGGEDDVRATVKSTSNAIWLALFDLTATPETEHHGTFLRGLRDASSQPVIALIDSSEFVARFGLSGERMQQRKRLWETFLKEQQIPYLIGDLASEDAHEIRVELAALL